MKPDWREIGRLEQEIYGVVISEEAAMALVMPRSDGLWSYTNAEDTYRLYLLLLGRTEDDG